MPNKKTETMIEPMEDHLIAKRDAPKTKTKGGLHLPEQARRNEKLATVKFVGPGRWDPLSNSRIPLQCKPGDRIILAEYAGSELKFGDDKYVVVRECDIIGRIHNAK